MKRRWIVGLALILALGACGEPQAGSDDALAADSEDIVWVDVRTPEEYQAGHVEGAILIPHDQMAQRYSELEQYEDREIVVYCRSGRRSGIAQGILQEAGFDNVTNGGGFGDLQARGVPVAP